MASPVTTPDDAPITARPGLLLLQVPPALLVSVPEVPTQTLALPVISDGNGFTETVTPPVVVQPAPLVATTSYILDPVVAGVIAGDAHEVQESPEAPDKPLHAKVAPDAIAVNVAELLRHIVADVDGDILSTGSALTVTSLTAEQPEDIV
jgi:hypothetical protein